MAIIHLSKHMGSPGDPVVPVFNIASVVQSFTGTGTFTPNESGVIRVEGGATGATLTLAGVAQSISISPFSVETFGVAAGKAITVA